MGDFGKEISAFLVALFSLAIVAVVVSKRSNTPSVITTLASGFQGLLNTVFNGASSGASFSASPTTDPSTGLFNVPSAPGASATSSGGILGTGSSTAGQWSAFNPYNVQNDVSSSGVIVGESDAPSVIDATLQQ